MQKRMHAYSGGSPTQVKSLILSWKVELNIKAVPKPLRVEDWEPLFLDP